MESDFKSDLGDVATPQPKKMKFESVVEAIEKLSKKAQASLLDIARTSNTKSPFKIIPKDKKFAELQKNGFLVTVSNNEALLQCYNHDDIIKRIQALGIPFDNKMKLDDLRQWCIENIPSQIETLFNDLVIVKINPKMSRQKIHYYLHRKLDYVPCFTANGDLVDIPLLETEFPNDEVTMLLKKYGYYK